jgi:hypothetical protein
LVVYNGYCSAKIREPKWVQFIPEKLLNEFRNIRATSKAVKTTKESLPIVAAHALGPTQSPWVDTIRGDILEVASLFHGQSLGGTDFAPPATAPRMTRRILATIFLVKIRGRQVDRTRGHCEWGAAQWKPHRCRTTHPEGEDAAARWPLPRHLWNVSNRTRRVSRGHPTTVIHRVISAPRPP